MVRRKSFSENIVLTALCSSFILSDASVFNVYKTAKKSYQDAAADCINKGGHLANVTSAGDLAFVANCSHLNGENNVYWIGPAVHVDKDQSLCRLLNVSNGGKLATMTAAKCSETNYYICETDLAKQNRGGSICDLFVEEVFEEVASHNDDYLLLAGSIIVSVIAVIIILAVWRIRLNDNTGVSDYSTDEDEDEDEDAETPVNRSISIGDVEYNYGSNEYNTQNVYIEMLNLNHLTLSF